VGTTIFWSSDLSSAHSYLLVTMFLKGGKK
jgi:hypothetical protein